MSANFIEIDTYTKDIAATATPENLIADAGGAQWKYAKRVILRAPASNSTALLIGNEDRRVWSLAAGAEVTLPSILNRMSQSGKYDLAKIFVEAQTNGDDVDIILIDPSNE